ncbi:hypothetical protein [Pedobacter sp. ASV28]|uniref:hypothetical protein n=1 Tax=Pedobacter sp. ASV28 TaxID=2795123 RepID=UPI0018ED6601|nr:hypothetical protein [Pedobacter sp. ASV28]
MKSKFFLTLLASLCLSVGYAQSVVINKIYNSGVTSPQGQDDVVELLVTQDHLDMRNLILKDFSGGSAANTTSFSEGAYFKFKDVPFWRSLRIGTVIVLRRLTTLPNYQQDTDPLDKVLDLALETGDYFEYNNSGGIFNITNYDMLMIKSGNGTGTANAIHTVACGINDDNATFEAISGPKMRTNKIVPTSGFLYPMNTSLTLADFSTENAWYSTTGNPIALTWGTGSGTGNVAFVNYLRSLGDYNYMHRSGDEEIAGNKSFSGNISIGTTDSKGYKLAIAGNMIAEEIKVKLQGTWPDYVFHKDYQLPSLTELEQFIGENNHLPGVPSEKEVKEAGNISLGEMNKILLKKIEELTLYVIEQQKVINKILENKK